MVKEEGKDIERERKRRERERERRAEVKRDYEFQRLNYINYFYSGAGNSFWCGAF